MPVRFVPLRKLQSMCKFTLCRFLRQLFYTHRKLRVRSKVEYCVGFALQDNLHQAPHAAIECEDF